MKLFYAASSVDDWGVRRGLLGLWRTSSLLAGNVAEQRVILRLRSGLLLVGSVLNLWSVTEIWERLNLSLWTLLLIFVGVRRVVWRLCCGLFVGLSILGSCRPWLGEPRCLLLGLLCTLVFS